MNIFERLVSGYPKGDVSPQDFFSLEANPWYYIMGVICLYFAVRGLVLYTKLPEKK